MKRPVDFVLGHVDWRIQWDEDEVNRHAPDAGGFCEEAEQRIVLLPMPKAPAVEREQLLHELLHACAFDSNFTLPYEQEEHMVRVVTPRLLHLLRANPHIVAFLTAQDER